MVRELTCSALISLQSGTTLASHSGFALQCAILLTSSVADAGSLIKTSKKVCTPKRQLELAILDAEDKRLVHSATGPCCIVGIDMFRV